MQCIMLYVRRWTNSKTLQSVLTLTTFGLVSLVNAQVVVQPAGNPMLQDASAMFQINSATGLDGPFTGFLPPRLDSAQRKLISTPTDGLLVYDTDLNTYMQFKTLLNRWDSVTTLSAPFWLPFGNAGAAANNFLGTTTLAPIRLRVNNQQVAHFGTNQLMIGKGSGQIAANNPSDELNSIAIGVETLAGGSGSQNIGIGYRALKSSTDAIRNIAVGNLAGEGNINTFSNIAIGREAMNLSATNTVLDNIAIGYRSMAGLSEGYGNVAIGREALRGATAIPVTLLGNVAIGDSVLYQSTVAPRAAVIGNLSASPGNTAQENTGLGFQTLGKQGAYFNTAVGATALQMQRGGIVAGKNTAVGYGALQQNTMGSTSVAIGAESLLTLTNPINQVFAGYSAGRNATGAENLGLGWQQLLNQTGTQNLHIGSANFTAGETLNQTVVIGAGNGQTSTGSLQQAILAGSNMLRSRTPAQQVIGLGYGGFGFSNAGENLIQLGIEGLTTHSTGSHVIALGTGATPASGTVSNAAVLGAQAKVFADNEIALGGTGMSRFLFGRGANDAGKTLTVGSNNTNGNGAYLSAAGTWTDVSDSSSKTDISSVGLQQLVHTIKQLPISRWRYKNTGEYHVGAMAQDFYRLLQLGVNNTTISHLDINGIALLLIGYLHKEQQQMLAELEKLEADNQQ